MYSNLQNQANSYFNCSLSYLNLSGLTRHEVIYIKHSHDIQLNINKVFVTTIIPNQWATLGVAYPIKTSGIHYELSNLKDNVIIANINNNISVFNPNNSYNYSGLSMIYPII